VGRSGVILHPKSGKPLGCYFPDVVASIEAAMHSGTTLDGELVILVDEHLSFGALQARLHPAASRVA